MRLICRSFLFFYLTQLCLSQNAVGQTWQISGFVSEMPSYSWTKEDKSSFNNLIHNRIKLERNYNNGFSLNVELRNRLISGGVIKEDATHKYVIGNDPGAIDMSFNLGTGDSYVFNSKFDRFSLNYRKGNFNVVLGRQRVDWGMSKIWNPNDIFNIYSFYDFDFEAKPGMDGVSFGYGNKEKGELSAVVKVDSNNKLSGATRYRLHTGSTTMQLLGGVINEEDYILGYGWNYKNSSVSFYGESSYFFPSKGTSSDNFVITIGGTYQSNKFMFGLEYLYSDYLEEDKGDVEELIGGRVSLKNLSLTDHTYNVTVGYQFTDKIKSSFDFIGFGYPVFDGGYIGTTTNYFINKNLTLSGIFQAYKQKWIPHKSEYLYAYVRLKMTF